MKRLHASLPGLGLLLAAALAIGFGGCAEKPRQAAGRLDTPEHHALRGNDFLAEGRLDEADRSFDLALSLNREFAPAQAGKAVVLASRSAQPRVSGDKRKELVSQARDLIKRALSDAKNDDEKREAHVAAIRVFQLGKIPDGWLGEAEDHFADATKLDKQRQDARPAFFMARAYRDAFEMQKAQELYQRVLGMNRGLTGEANDELATVQKILRAAPGTRHGRAVAFEEKITKADIAALFVEELKLASIYGRGNPPQADTGFRPPEGQQGFQADTLQRAPEATDIGDHPLKADIEEAMKLKIAGLEPGPDHRFSPDQPITRAEFALMVEDILVKVTGERGLRTKFIGSPSPFADVRNDLPYFNAVQVVVSRNLMEPKNKVRGIFGPADAVGGADALLVIRMLKNELQSFIRS
ncbi:MAG: S-layer homology domain-containing protein [Candidatus Lambdaproteobacteria bacterium]|nr:S-layer homology domain-containing protein [Candidatus Lambdaproteobacteria bacterium]